MPDASPAAPAAPAVGNPAGGGRPASPPAAKSPAPAPKAAEVKPDAPEGGDDAWGEADAAELQKYLKKLSKHDARARVRVRGEEKGLESLDDLFGVVTDAQRGRGASKVVEEAKREAEEAKRVKALAEKARGGDLQALRELAGDGAFEGLEKLRGQQSEEEALLGQLSETERFLYEQAKGLRAQLDAKAKAEESAKAEAETRATEERKAKVRGEAQQLASRVMESLKLSPEAAETVLPYVARAMRRAHDVGLEVGADVPPEQLLAEAQQEMQGVLTQALAPMATPALADFLGPQRLRALAKEFQTRYERGRAQVQQHPAAQQQQARQTQRAEPELGSLDYLLGRPARR